MVRKKAKYKIGEKVYSYLNPTSPGRINRISYEKKGTPYQNRYRLTLKSGRNSKWINETSLSKRRKR